MKINVGRNGVRNGRYGNPFQLRDHSREQSVALFVGHATQLLTDDDLAFLHGKELWCPGCSSKNLHPCHADVLAWLVNHPRNAWHNLVRQAWVVLGWDLDYFIAE